jgi:hypothetical protein
MISAKKAPSINNRQIDHLRKRLEAWRKSHRGSRARIPDRLWNSAVWAAGHYGLNRTAKVLRLNYYDLKKRLDAASVMQGPVPSFIELSPVATGLTPECIIELENRNGAKMRIHLKGIGSPDLNVLSDTFWRGKR